MYDSGYKISDSKNQSVESVIFSGSKMAKMVKNGEN